MEYKALLTDFASGLGISDIAFDEDGVARIQADDMVVSFMEVPERRALLTWAEVATPPPENLTQLYKLLLEAMFMGRATQGATFSCENDTIYLHRMDDLGNLDTQGLSKILEDFLNLVEQWRKVIEAFRADDTAPAEGAAVEEAPQEFGLGGPAGFMQV